MPLGEYMSAHTHRQHKTLVAWLDDQWNVPDRIDYYLMQLTYEVRQVLSTKPKEYKPGYCRIEFKMADAQNVPLSDEDLRNRAELAKGGWIAAVGGKVTEEFIRPDHEEDRLPDPESNQE